MRLSQRLRPAADPSVIDLTADTAAPRLGATPPPPPAGPPAAVAQPHTTPTQQLDAGPSAAASDPLAEIKTSVRTTLFATLGAALEAAQEDDGALRARVESETRSIVASARIPLSDGERDRLVADVVADALGHGPIQPLLEDDSITEIMVNGTRPVYVERNGRLQQTGVRFSSDRQLRQIIERIVARVGRRIDESTPMVDARLADGSRINAIIPPLAVDGPSLTIRKFAREAYQIPDLLRFGTLTEQTAQLLEACVQGRLNIIISGGTGTGKTTLLNVLSGYIPGGERIVTIEDAVELQLRQAHVVRLESRPANVEGRGEVTIRDLVRNALRMRPDRIVVGETRGAEALDMLQAMNTGHDGSLSTVHANAPRDALSRIETMTLMAGFDLPLRAIREQIASAVDLVVQISRLRDGSRRITSITEVAGMQGDVVTMQDLFQFDFAAGFDEEGRYRGGLLATGIRPTFTERLATLGIALPAPVLEPTGSGLTARAGRR